MSLIIKVISHTLANKLIKNLSCVAYLAPPDDQAFLRVVHELYIKHDKFPEALSISLRLADRDLILQDYQNAGNP